MTENEIAYKIRGGIYAVYNTLGPGLYESVYEKALIVELNKQGIKIRAQVPILQFMKVLTWERPFGWTCL